MSWLNVSSAFYLSRRCISSVNQKVYTKSSDNKGLSPNFARMINIELGRQIAFLKGEVKGKKCLSEAAPKARGEDLLLSAPGSSNTS